MREHFFELTAASLLSFMLSVAAIGGGYTVVSQVKSAVGSLSQPSRGGDDVHSMALRLVDFSVSCATSATQVVPSGSDGIEDAFIYNNSSTPVYVGGSSVGTSTGIPICTDTASCVQSSISLNIVRGGVYCKVSSGTVSVRVLSGAYAP